MSDWKAQLAAWKVAGEQVVFTNGVFDILHVGHVDYLTKARALGDRLVLGLNSDASVRRLNKGPERPVNPEAARKQVLEALRCVDLVVVFDTDTPLPLILEVKPDVLVKGGDYDPEETDASKKTYLVGSQEVRTWGGRAQIIALVDGFSTTNILEKLKKG
ncbi:MAG: D-glycero-beta-D-manno-heptose 1-phosphate adenylyltransferase [Flavobacteriales bacterium]